MIYEHKSYRSYLKEVLADRTFKNPKYSLRAMAKQLGFAPSSLSEVISGSANFSLESGKKLASKLNLTSQEREYFYLLIQMEGATDPEVKESLLSRMRAIRPQQLPIHDLSVDQFRKISEWYHSAILEMVDLSNFDFTPNNISKKLGISKIEAEVAIERLVRLELLEKDKNGRFVRIHDQLLTQTSPTNFQALRNFFRQMLQKASDALGTQTPKERISGYETMSISSDALPEAKEITEKYFNEMIALAHRYPKKKNVYHLVVHFFNLTTGKE